MQVQSNNFISLAQIDMANEQLRAAVKKGTSTAYNNRISAVYAHGHEHGEALRAQAAAAKRAALQRLPDLLEQAEQTLSENGMTVLWAETDAEARGHVLDIARRHEVSTVAKSKSMVTEEIALNKAMIDNGLDVVETDLGEWILQLNDEPPSHVIAPVIHKTKDSIVDVFRNNGYTGSDDAKAMAGYAREQLRSAFLNADMGVSGGNFIIAETGSLALVMNEGNGRMVTNLPRVHVALVGIEKVIPSLHDYKHLVQMLTRSGTGQKITVYSHMVNGPRREEEPDGPEHVYVIFVDNGRSDIYAQADYTEALACIRCGACQNACPVYQTTGGHAYGWVYGGPIGAVITPLLTGKENASPLPYASTLCGACKSVCPVDIDLPRMLLDLRRDLVAEGHTDRGWEAGMRMWRMGNVNPSLYRSGGTMARLARQWFPNQTPGALMGWMKYRDFPDFAPQSFHQQWKSRRKEQSK